MIRQISSRGLQLAREHIEQTRAKHTTEERVLEMVDNGFITLEQAAKSLNLTPLQVSIKLRNRLLQKLKEGK
jgi:hypothetical protein